MGIWPKVGIGALGITAIVGMGTVVLAFMNRPLMVKISEIVPVQFVDAGELAVGCSLGAQDPAKKEVKTGDSIVISCVITNTSKKEYKDLVLQTGTDQSKINYVRELQGATGMSAGDIVSFANIVVLAKGKTEVSIVATTNYSQEPYELIAKPELKQEQRTIATGKEEKLAIGTSGHQPQVRVQKSSSEEGEAQ